MACVSLFFGMSFAQLPHSALELIGEFLPVDVEDEDSPALCALGRWASSLRLWGFLARVRLTFEDLWQRREELQYWNDDLDGHGGFWAV